MQRFILKSIRLNKKYPIKRLFSTDKTSKNTEKPSDDNIWEEVDDENENDQTSNAHRYRRYMKKIVLWSLFGWLGINAYYAVKLNFDEEAAKSQTFYNHYVFSVSNCIMRGSNTAYNYLLFPPISKFLTDEPPLRPELLRKTLILNFEGTLYSKDFSAGNGVLIHLRPGFKKFIDKISQIYDVVLYSNEDTAFMSEVINTIDPYQRYFMWNFGREFFTTKSGGSYKDLTFINRDPKKFIVVDFSLNNYLNHKDNVVLLDKYEGQMEDSGLKELGLFLEHCANPTIKDVRKEIKKFGGEDSVRTYYDEMQKKMDSVKKKRNMLFGFSGKGKNDHN